MILQPRIEFLGNFIGYSEISHRLSSMVHTMARVVLSMIQAKTIADLELNFQI